MSPYEENKYKAGSNSRWDRDYSESGRQHEGIFSTFPGGPFGVTSYLFGASSKGVGHAANDLYNVTKGVYNGVKELPKTVKKAFRNLEEADIVQSASS